MRARDAGVAVRPTERTFAPLPAQPTAPNYGWPPRMLMRIACAYTGRSRWALGRAVREGMLRPAGRNGRTLVFDRAELDRWMVGSAPHEPNPIRDVSRSTSAPATSAALARLQTLTARRQG